MFKNYLWVIIETGSNIGFQFLSLVVLSKFLGPQDYGVWGMMAIFISIGNMLADSGMGGALIKKKYVCSLDYNTLFVFNIVISCLFYILLYVLAPLISDFYDQIDLTIYLRIYSISILIGAFGIVQTTRIVRKMDFKPLAIMSLIAGGLGFIIACFCAMHNMGVWALILQNLVSISTKVLGLYVYNKFIPNFTFSRQSFIEQFNFGIGLLLANILSTIYSNIVSSIIPKIGTIRENGLYVQGSRIQACPLAIIQGIIDRAVFPKLCSEVNKGVDLLSRVRHLVKRITPIIFSFIFLIYLFAKPIVIILLGKNWIDVVPYLKVLTLSSYGLCYMAIVRNFFKSIGKTKIILKIETVKSFIGLIIVFSSSFLGIDILLYGLVISSVLLSCVTSFYVNKYIKYSLIDQFYDIKLALILFIINIAIHISL